MSLLSLSHPTGHDILFIVNAAFGGRNTPGFRPYQLIRFGQLMPEVIARASAVSYQPMRFPLPGRGLIPRGLNALRVKLWPSLPSRAIEQALFDRRCLALSRRLKWRPRAVHLWDALPETAAFWHAQGVPLVLDLQMAHPRCYEPLIAAGMVDPESLGLLEDMALDRCLPLADRLVCPSRFVRDSLPAAVHGKTVVIPFGADSPRETPGHPVRKGQPLRVLFAGNVNTRKGIPFLIEAWCRLPPALASQAELVLCGRQFREMAGLLAGIPPGVRAVGFQSAMAAWFESADVFVLPSLMEGSAKAVYEAMAQGLPVIVSSHAGSIVEHGIDGWVVPPADSEALATALIQLLEDAALRQRLGMAARASAARYTWARYAAAVADLHRAWPVPGTRPRLADTYRAHHAPQPLAWRLRRLAERAAVGFKARGRRIGGQPSTWLRFPFYHHVFADERRGFARHLAAMRQRGEFITLDQAIDLLTRGDRLDGRYFCLTFDDGFRNILTHALPILASHQAPAAVFVISGLVPDHPGDWCPEQDRFFGTRRRPAAFLTWDDCRALAAAGVTIGSHSASHQRRLIELNEAEVEWELATSKARIEAMLGRPCDHFCCPWGKPGRDFQVDRDPILAARLGYRSFLTTRWGAVELGDSPFAIRRVGLVAGWDLAQIRYFLSL
ncbi:MAG: glycosyltransferase [Pseudomonadota bacterium]